MIIVLALRIHLQANAIKQEISVHALLTQRCQWVILSTIRLSTGGQIYQTTPLTQLVPLVAGSAGTSTVIVGPAQRVHSPTQTILRIEPSIADQAVVTVILVLQTVVLGELTHSVAVEAILLIILALRQGKYQQALTADESVPFQAAQAAASALIIGEAGTIDLEADPSQQVILVNTLPTLVTLNQQTILLRISRNTILIDKFIVRLTNIAGTIIRVIHSTERIRSLA